MKEPFSDCRRRLLIYYFGTDRLAGVLMDCAAIITALIMITVASINNAPQMTNWVPYVEIMSAPRKNPSEGGTAILAPHGLLFHPHDPIIDCWYMAIRLAFTLVEIIVTWSLRHVATMTSAQKNNIDSQHTRVSCYCSGKSSRIAC